MPLLLLYRAAWNARAAHRGTPGMSILHSSPRCIVVAGRSGFRRLYCDWSGDEVEEAEQAGEGEWTSSFRSEETSRYPESVIDMVLSDFESLRRNPDTRRLERLLTLRRGANGKFENLIDVVADKSLLVAAYQRLRTRPGVVIPEIGTEGLPLEWFRTARQLLLEGNYQFADYTRTDVIRRYGARASLHSLRQRYTFLMVNLWALRTKRSDILCGRCDFYDMKPEGLRDFTLDFFLNYSLASKFKARQQKPPTPVGDLIVQEAVHMALEHIYEPYMSSSVHAYRPQRGCHTMFEEIKSWLGVTWLLEFDMGKFYDRCDKGILASTLEEQIQDDTFVQLIMNLCEAKVTVSEEERISPRMQRRLKRGPLEAPEYEAKAVEGSVLAPLLCHIYLQKLDNEVLRIKEEQERYHPGPRRRSIFTLRPQEKPPEQLPVMVRYSRYMDEFVVGVSGSVYVVEKVQDLILRFLDSTLRIQPAYATYVDISFGSTMILGMTVTAAKSTFDPATEAKILEKRKRCRFRFLKLGEFRARCWEERIQKLTARAWMKGLKKTRGAMKSLWKAKEMLDQKAEYMVQDFAIAKLESGETRLAVEELLNCENAVFYNMAAIGIPEEIYRASEHLRELLANHLHLLASKDKDPLVPTKPKGISLRKNLIVHCGAYPIRLFAPVEMIMADLRYKGMIRGEDRAAFVSSLINAPDESIVSYFAALAYGLLGYYRCSDNYIKVKRMVDYQVRWGAILTLAYRHDYSPRKTIVEYKRGPQMVTTNGEVIAALPSSPVISRMGAKAYGDMQETALKDIMRYMNA